MSWTCNKHKTGGFGDGPCWKCEAEGMASIYDEDNCVWVTGEVCGKCGGGILAPPNFPACANCGAPPTGRSSAPEKPDAASMLRKAAELIEQRGAQRDRPAGEKTMAATINAFNAIYGTSLTEVQGWHLMELLKMVRSAYGVYVEDDYLDKIAYAALAGEAANATDAR